MTVRRGTTNRNDRGSAEGRRRRRQWLLDTFGDGTTCRCSTCPTVLDFDSITVDRHPVAGVDGGTYRRGNIRPQCAPCASRQGGKMSAQRRTLRKGHMVRIRKGGKVYRVVVIDPDKGLVRIAAGAKHPDAAKRVVDGFRLYAADTLIRVPA
ncbi:Uncharacterised protein [Mycobacteroides abscessus subsp. abscessus]|uniref:peptidylprolyl isomerase n=1 Tax=Mycobacteroides abscessus TaxID=36809 RepID=UPI00092AC558|nr:peptidylprolyl isomerase [Mycobacteroides abscessus]SII88849.1 Uncharacterised protein [Mycobacteroides abscessus subsp. abscessus]SIL12372.1 Uncharacterised protein [Mycobacteroides abscessus subsp. abscessus]SLK60247.1 Uncharacterised protein [Mycobacteroides abscessus subsp. abscessus]